MVNRYGLTQVYAPQGGGLVDIVFVHGLNGNPYKTWTSEKTKTFWPSALLPPVIEDTKARILVYGYDADVTSFTDGASKDKIHNHAESLVANLRANRNIRRANERPIIFVAHSLGGLVVKRALIYSAGIRGNNTEHLRSIFVSTYAILFLGTPHQGADVAEWGSRLEWICGAVLPSNVVDSQPQLIDALKRNNETLQVIDREFVQMMNRFHIYFFHEGKPTKLGMKKVFIVDEMSASPNVQDVERASIQADHSHMCKFDTMESAGFDLVAEALMRYAGAAPDVIKSRWGQEKAESLAKRQAQIQEIIPGEHFSTSSLSYKINLLMCIGSVAGTPHSDTTSATHTPTPGKTSHQLALPGLEERRPTQEIFEAYEVEEPAEKDMMEVER